MSKSSVLSFFEIKRPLKNSSSVSHLDKIINEDEIKPKERLFVRHSSTLPKSTRYKKKLSNSTNSKNANMSEEIEDNNINVKSLARKFENIIETQLVQHEYRRSHSFIQTSQFMTGNGDAGSIEMKTSEVEKDLGRTSKENNIDTVVEKSRTKSESRYCSNNISSNSQAGSNEMKINKLEKDLGIVRDDNKVIETPRTESESRYYSNSINRKERRKNIKSFGEAETEEEKESYRRKLLEEMDEQFARMKMDGFLDDTEKTINEKHNDENYNSTVKRSFKYSKQTSSKTEEKELIQTDLIVINCGNHNPHVEPTFKLPHLTSVNTEKTKINKRRDENHNFHEERTFNFSQQPSVNSEENKFSRMQSYEKQSNYASNESYGIFTDDFTESLGDDLENGSFVVEAYNDDGRELIILELSIEKKVVNLSSLQSIREVMEESEIVFIEDENSTLSTVTDPEEIVHKSTNSVPEEPIYEEISMYIPSSTSKRFSAPPYAQNEETEYSEVFYEEPPVETRSSPAISSESSRCEEDEGISTSYENVYGSVRRETFCDNQGNIRIERIGYPEKNDESSDEAIPSPVSRNNSISSTKRLSYLIEEIQMTEGKYVNDLEKIAKLYIPYIEKHTPPQLTHLHNELFGNISRIWRKQKKFCKAILNCGENVDDIANAFIENENLFDLYPLYLKNKPKSDMILKEFQQITRQMQEHFGERLDFSAYLLTPLQRLGKYILFIENIEKELKKVDGSCENIQKALEIVRSVMSRGNDCVAIESIQRSPVSKVDYGSFIMREKFTLLKPRRLETMVFLFSNIVVFTAEDQKCIELFTYYDSIKMDDLRIATFEDGTIHLIDFTKSKRHRFNSQRYTFVLETKVDKVRNTWRETIEQMLWEQLAKEKANSLKVGSGSTKKKQTAKRRPKSTGASIFYAL